jgi:hypothetical protein
MVAGENHASDVAGRAVQVVLTGSSSPASFAQRWRDAFLEHASVMGLGGHGGESMGTSGHQPQALTARGSDHLGIGRRPTPAHVDRRMRRVWRDELAQGGPRQDNRQVPFRLTRGQAEQALGLCAVFPPRTGMYVGPVSWATVDAFWSGYVSSWPDGAYRVLQEFATEQLGPSNITWVSRLYEAHNAGEAREQHLDRERGREVATHICSMISAFVNAHRDA